MDREKVIEEIKNEIHLGEYWDESWREVELDLLRDVLELLKEQEPVKPKTDDAWPSRIKVCGACGTCLFAVGDYKPKYCSECGRMVDWH